MSSRCLPRVNPHQTRQGFGARMHISAHRLRPCLAIHPEIGHAATVVADARAPKRSPPTSPRARTRPTSAPSAKPTDDVIDEQDDIHTKQWLFREDDAVLGPVAASVILDKLKSLALRLDDEVAPDGGSFAPISRISGFAKAAQMAAASKARADAEAAYASSVTRSKMARAAALMALFLVPALISAAGAHWLMQKRPWDDTPAWVLRVPPLVDLPAPPPNAVPNVAVPQDARVAVNDAPAASDEPDADRGDRGDPRRGRDDKRKSGKDGKDAKDNDAKTAAKDGKDAKAADATPPPVNDSVVQESLSNEQAVAPLKSVSGDFKSCFKAEMASNPNMPEVVKLSYTVTEDGKAINIDLDPKDLRGRPVVDCVRKAMGGLRWPKFKGERKNVSIPFKLGKPKPAGG
jgi:hypothetical protein